MNKMVKRILTGITAIGMLFTVSAVSNHTSASSINPRRIERVHNYRWQKMPRIFKGTWVTKNGKVTKNDATFSGDKYGADCFAFRKSNFMACRVYSNKHHKFTHSSLSSGYPTDYYAKLRYRNSYAILTGVEGQMKAPKLRKLLKDDFYNKHPGYQVVTFHGKNHMSIWYVDNNKLHYVGYYHRTKLPKRIVA